MDEYSIALQSEPSREGLAAWPLLLRASDLAETLIAIANKNCCSTNYRSVLRTACHDLVFECARESLEIVMRQVKDEHPACNKSLLTKLFP